MNFKEKDPKQESKDKEKIKILERDKSVDLPTEKPKSKKQLIKPIEDPNILQSFQNQIIEDSSPSLEKVEIASPGIGATNLEQQVGFNSQIQNKENDKEDPFKYNTGSDSVEGPQYTSLREEGAKMFQAERTNPLDFRREKPFETNVQEVGRSGFFEQKSDSKNIETYVPVKNVDPLKSSKGDIFEKQNIQYSPSED